MNSMSKIIREHNKKVTLKPSDQRPKQNQRKKAGCPMEGNCQVNNIVYKCDVIRPLPKKCIQDLQRENGRAVSSFYNYKLSFKHKRSSNKTTLSSHMWHLKKVSSETPNLKWSRLRCISPYSDISKKYLLCLYEKRKTGNSY